MQFKLFEWQGKTAVFHLAISSTPLTFDILQIFNGFKSCPIAFSNIGCCGMRVFQRSASTMPKLFLFQRNIIYDFMLFLPTVGTTRNLFDISVIQIFSCSRVYRFKSLMSVLGHLNCGALLVSQMLYTYSCHFCSGYW